MYPMRGDVMTSLDKARCRAFVDGAHHRCHGRHDLPPVAEIAAAALPEAALFRDLKNKKERIASLLPLVGAIKCACKALVTRVGTFSTLRCERCHSNSRAPLDPPTRTVARRTAMTALRGLLNESKG
jgi:hypothetical protein